MKVRIVQCQVNSNSNSMNTRWTHWIKRNDLPESDFFPCDLIWFFIFRFEYQCVPAALLTLVELIQSKIKSTAVQCDLCIIFYPSMSSFHFLKSLQFERQNFDYVVKFVEEKKIHNWKQINQKNSVKIHKITKNSRYTDRLV